MSEMDKYLLDKSCTLLELQYTFDTIKMSQRGNTLHVFFYTLRGKPHDFPDTFKRKKRTNFNLICVICLMIRRTHRWRSQMESIKSHSISISELFKSIALDNQKQIDRIDCGIMAACLLLKIEHRVQLRLRDTSNSALFNGG